MRRARVNVVERHPRDEGDVARDERQHARREKAREPSAEGDRHTDGARQCSREGNDDHGSEASDLLRWYFALKYRVFRRERRPDDGRRGLVMLQIDALVVRRAASRASSWATARRSRRWSAKKATRCAAGSAGCRRRRRTARPESFTARTTAFPRFASTTRPSGASSRATRRPACSTSAIASTRPARWPADRAT